MSESMAHTRLVGVIVDWVKVKHSATKGLCLYCDCPPVLETEKPNPIDGFFPDVCAVTTPPEMTLLGEAKTTQDLESLRSYNQILAFLRFLSVRPCPMLIIATPWRATATAKHIIVLAKREACITNVDVQFLNEHTTLC